MGLTEEPSLAANPLAETAAMPFSLVKFKAARIISSLVNLAFGGIGLTSFIGNLCYVTTVTYYKHNSAIVKSLNPKDSH